MQRHKRGDSREDGMVFWQYGKHYPNGEFWTTPEKFQLKLSRQREKKADRYREDSKRILAANKQWREKNPEKLEACVRSYYLKNREKGLKDRQEHYRKNREKYIKLAAICHKNRRKTDLLYALRCLCRNRLSDAFRRGGWKKPCTTQTLLGCDYPTLKKHLEAQFTGEMSWENRGKDGWHIDHIIPLASAETSEKLLELLHYTNLQPLWAFDNLSKGSKHNKHQNPQQ